MSDYANTEGSQSTQPFSPPPSNDQAATRFLTLTPDNELATRVVAHCAVDILRDKHHSRFFDPDVKSVSEPQEATQAVTTANFVATKADDGTADNDDAIADTPPVQCFVLDLTNLPITPEMGWSFGAGSSRNKKHRGVDLLIQTTRSILPSPIIGLIFIHPESGAFMLRAMSDRCPIVYRSALNGRDQTLRKGDKTVLWMERNILRFGLQSLDFVLDIAVGDQALFAGCRNNFLRSMEARHLPHNGLDVVPSTAHMRMDDFILHPTKLGRGTFGRVRAAVQASTGRAVAVKVSHADNASQVQAIQDESTIVALLDHPHIISFLGIWCDHGSTQCGSPCDYYMAMPLAEMSFASHFRTDDVTAPARRRLFRDILQGLAFLHAKGIMHRDISLNNLLVFRRDVVSSHDYPWMGQICDFGKAVKAQRHYDTRIGPIDTLAPEVWPLLDEGARQNENFWYSNRIDLWALGYAYLNILSPASDAPGRPKTDARRHQKLVASVERLFKHELIGSSERDLLALLLQFDAEERPSADEALKHPNWQENGPGTHDEAFGMRTQTVMLPQPAVSPSKRTRYSSQAAAAKDPVSYESELPDTLPWE